MLSINVHQQYDNMTRVLKLERIWTHGPSLAADLDFFYNNPKHLMISIFRFLFLMQFFELKILEKQSSGSCFGREAL